jgi:hypothetical protein
VRAIVVVDAGTLLPGSVASPISSPPGARASPRKLSSRIKARSGTVRDLLPRCVMFVGVLAFVCSSSLAQDFTPGELDALTLIREADLGVTRVYVDQHSFSYELPADLVTPDFEWRGALLWRYDGQQTYSDAPVEGSGLVEYTEKDYVLTGVEFDADAYFGVGRAKRFDRYGRRWVLDYVDADEARRVHEENDAANALINGGPEPGVEANPGIEYNPDAGAVHYGLPVSWDTVNCSGADAFFDHVGNGAMTEATATPMNDRQRKMVFIIINAVGFGSGVMVDSDTVLTAGHVVTDSNGQLLQSAFTVCSMENLDENTTGGHEAACFGVVDVDPGPNWTADGDALEDDFALLHLDGAPGNGWMELSSATDATITGPTDFRRAYPGFKRNCAVNTVTNVGLTTDDAFPGRLLFSADGEVQATPTGWVKWDTSSAPGASGSPHFYCPTNDDCSMGHFITGVGTNTNLSCTWDGDSYVNPPCSSGYTAGPKARDIETWVDNNL